MTCSFNEEDAPGYLYDFVKQFVNNHKVSCADAVYQRDSLVEMASEFMEECLNIVGYYEDEN